MRRISIFILLAIALIHCKSDRDPNPLIKSATGKWRPVEYTSSDGTKTAVTNSDADFLQIREDGVLLNKNGYRPCCYPNSYKLNGVRVDFKPGKPAEIDPICVAVSCAACDDVRIKQESDNELRLTYCTLFEIRYERVL